MKNKTILITGGTTGIGLATAQLLQSEGAQVIVTGRNEKTLAEARSLLGPKAIVIRSDSASIADAQALGAEVKKHVKRLDGAFLNAGIAQFGPIADMTPELFDAQFNVNVRGLYFQLQSLLDVLANPSTVVLTSSTVARLGRPGTSVYSATKAAVTSLGKTLAVELAPRGIRLNTLSPGPIKTPIFGKMGAPSAADIAALEETLAKGTVLKRLGTVEEMAKAARYLLSEDSGFAIGQELLVDGGNALV
jgi:NAD(P)-dependent dehydrogenase (short-subunit alcohol dehydrogenase family)